MAPQLRGRASRQPLLAVGQHGLELLPLLFSDRSQRFTEGCAGLLGAGVTVEHRIF